MADLLCQHCGTLVKVRGMAAVCPNCKELVTPPPPSMQVEDSSPLESLPPRLFPQAQTEPPQPAPPLSIPEPRIVNNTWKIVGITLAALIGLVFVIDYVRLRLKPPTVVQVVQPAPPPVQQRASPATQRKNDRPSIFSEDLPATRATQPGQPPPRRVAVAVSEPAPD